jgi:hypothetical protein
MPAVCCICRQPWFDVRIGLPKTLGLDSHSAGMGWPKMAAVARLRSAANRNANGVVLAKVTKDLTDPPTAGRTSLVTQRFQTITSALLSDQGGEQCTEARRQLCRRFAAAAVLAESMETELANGKKIDIPTHALLCSTLVRIARQIGVNRIAKVVNVPNLQQYLTRKQTGEAAE